MKTLSARKAALLFLALNAGMILFHLGVILGFVPAEIVWGGKLDESRILSMELFAISVTIAFMGILSFRAGLLPRRGPLLLWKILSWVVFAYLLLNTVGNVLSSTRIERFLFGALALVLAALVLRVNLDRSNGAAE